MTTAFVLSGGGSLGAVQVGMLQALTERGETPDLLVGTSAGALNATYLAGHGISRDSLHTLAALWAGLRRRDVFPISPGRQLLAAISFPVGGSSHRSSTDSGPHLRLVSHAIPATCPPLR